MLILMQISNHLNCHSIILKYIKNISNKLAINGKLGNIYISDITSEINTDYVDGSVYVYSTNRTIRVIAKLTTKEDIPAWTHIINNLGWSGINIYFYDVNNQIGINWNGNYMQNTIVVSKNNTFNIDIECIV